MTKKPMATEEVFSRIQTFLKAKDKLPDTFGYGLSANNPVLIKTYEFELNSNLAYGGNEGIYLDLCIE